MYEQVYIRYSRDMRYVEAVLTGVGVIYRKPIGNNEPQKIYDAVERYLHEKASEQRG